MGAGLVLSGPAAALPAQTLRFPRDHGSHPDFRTEWWYLTGRLEARAPAREFGFQLTFFRTRVATAQTVQSAFAARQLLAAHAAVTDLASGRLLHDQRLARAGFGVAQADEDDTRIRLRDWSLVRQNGRYRAQVAGPDIDFTLEVSETQPLLLQGQDGLSRKGPEPRQASYYYSLPQLQVTGELQLQGRAHPVQGRAWLDHEWSQELLHPQAVGWDWIGMNLQDGSALTAFQLRDRHGRALWEGGSFRHPAMGAGARPYVFAPGEVEFRAARHWISPLTGARYPVEWRIRTPADIYTVRARLDNQELDSRASTGTVYWEGLAELVDSQGRPVGQGYLEMTGYVSPLRL
ncbi:MAG: carotenoid 1,2-hydratase [Rhodoferax sp.]|nr:carotenoid 1,2-hydratase [Rhodoferax sp.]